MDEQSQLLIVVFAIIGILVAWRLITSAIARSSGSRQCPRCGSEVPMGELDCESCGFDYRTIGASE
ncbi:MAG: hypothetical protein QOI31_1694 [Solirubrobacterales bacterium]|jgi:hypothetical protein|nr:hypothetical protein [Solirubrobacterales bacterium]